ncbi:MAG TPA: alpha/beta hydrolase [Methylocella sp.]|nr:alpha/beta hydrolase [Methylocella sp.]
MRRFTFWLWRTGFRGRLAACVRESRLPPRHFPVLVITVFGLASCAAPKGFLEPVAARAPGTSQVEMLVATTRTRTTPAEMFSGFRGPALDFADIVVSLPPDSVRQIGEVQLPRQIPGDPATDFVTRKADYNDRAQALATFRRLVRTTPKKQVLVFVHGFNNRFEDAVFRFAQIVHDSGADDVVPVLFTWPSKGSVFAYGYDHESASYSRDALEDGLRALAKNPEVGEITVLAHSMGNWVTLEALRQMAIRDGKVAEKIHNVMLAAPDVDVDIAREQITAMGARRPQFTLFVSEEDHALALSRKVWGEPRLGSINPDQEPYKSNLARERIGVINLTGVSSADQLNHGTFAENPQIVELIGRSIASGQTLTDSKVGFGEKILQTTAGATASVGHAAGLVVTAPVAIVDPLTREQYGDQVDAFGQSVRDAATPQ